MNNVSPYLAKIPPLSTKNYEEWRYQAENILRIAGAWEVVVFEPKEKRSPWFDSISSSWEVEATVVTTTTTTVSSRLNVEGGSQRGGNAPEDRQTGDIESRPAPPASVTLRPNPTYERPTTRSMTRVVADGSGGAGYSVDEQSSADEESPIPQHTPRQPVPGPDTSHPITSSAPVTQLVVEVPKDLDSKCLGILRAAVGPIENLFNQSTCNAMWQSIVKWGREISMFKLGTLNREFSNLEKGENECITAYFMRGYELALKIEELGARVEEWRCVNQLLEGLHDEIFQEHKAALFEKGVHLLRFSTTLSSMRTREHLKPQSKIPSVPSLAAGAHAGASGAAGQSGPRVCGHCKKPGHLQDSCWQLFPEKRQKGYIKGKKSKQHYKAKPAKQPVDEEKIAAAVVKALVAMRTTSIADK